MPERERVCPDCGKRYVSMTGWEHSDSMDCLGYLRERIEKLETQCERLQAAMTNAGIL